ncbi:MAG: hypothetical protein HKO76_02615 [Acidimicrobiia bacterium]|nr:hypothetical protein [Acidimicrobiia bacterium]
MTDTPYKDLLGRSYATWNCGEVVSEYLYRIGQHDASEWIPVDQETAAKAIRDEGYRWEKVGDDPTKVKGRGVVILADGTNGHLQAAITIGNGKALTSSRTMGVHAVSLTSFRRRVVHGCYVWRGSE